ncbi:aminotransferase class I and II [Candidatus Vecturithrix granuli]|uniref:Aminotransferase n=1 Tax=Vecturithrix granuli TaxID=1499967 RepID=A0A081C607_VECG1|nr:aminotransferase class I and II [Candidatus Vecturithrix granuli]
MSVAKKIEEKIVSASWIRKMFDQGQQLKAQYGNDKVFDFTLGNPYPEPPTEFKQALIEVAQDPRPGLHGYMTNAGYPFVREEIAAYLCQEHDINITADELIITCGAAGALNVILKTLLDPGDEVLCPKPFFVEYGAYADNHGGVLKTVPTNPDFTLNLDAIANAITPRTKVMLINSPNNPTGQVYSQESIAALGTLLREKSQQHGKTIYLLTDEPYRDIVYDGIEVPSVLKYYDESILATSYSKVLSIPGERLGFLAVNPKAAHRDNILAGAIMCNRTLGFVNAPAMMQRVVAKVQGKKVDVSIYKAKRDLLCEGLAQCGYEVTKPVGAFYLFLKTPIADDTEFVKALQDELILTVPGSSFGGPGHIRIAYCVDDQTIINSMPGFKKVLTKYMA